MRRRYLLRADTIQNALDRHHLTHQRFADHLGLSRAYWSKVFHRRRHLSPSIRLRLLASEHLSGIGEAELWDVVDHDGAVS